MWFPEKKEKECLNFLQSSLHTLDCLQKKKGKRKETLTRISFYICFEAIIKKKP